MRTSLLVLVALFVLTPFASAAAPQRKVLELVETLESGSVAEQIASAQSLAELGKRASKATPALVRSLASEEAALVDASVEALIAIGSKAREPLAGVLEEGTFEGASIPRAPAARALLGLGKKGEAAVDAFVESAEPGPELFAMFEGFGERGAPYLVAAAAASDDDALEALRSLRRLAAREVRQAESLEEVLEDVEDEDLALAARFAWTQTPSASDVSVFRRWIEGDRLALVDTGLWCSGLLGSKSAKAGDAIAQRLAADEATIRATALWALGGLATPAPAPPQPVVPASYPGASKNAQRAIDDVVDDKVFTIWRDAGKSLGYRGRIGAEARELWAIAPTWTSRVEPVPAAPDPKAVPAALRDAEPRLLAIAGEAAQSDERIDEAKIASRALTHSGAQSETARDLWLSWLTSDSVDLRLEALLGLRTFGRGIIDHEALIIQQLEAPETRVAAAQVLTKIATPTAWGAVVQAVASSEGKPPLPLLIAISRYDDAALRPALERFRALYHEGHYIVSAFLIRYGSEVVDDFAVELGAGLADRRMVAAESLGHLGAAAQPALPKLEKLKERHPISQQLIRDSVARIKSGG